MKVFPQKDWLYVHVKKTTVIGRIEVPDIVQSEEQIITVLHVGKDVKLAKCGDEILIVPNALVGHYIPNETTRDEMKGFVQEESIMGIVKED